MSEALGIPVPDLPEDMVASEVVVIARVLLPEGHPMGAYAVTTLASDGLFPWDVIGMARYAQLTAEEQLMGSGTEEDDG